MSEPVTVAWERATKFDRRGATLADGHYSRRTVGSPQFMPPGETVVLISPDGAQVFGWWRPHPGSGLKSMNGLDGWTCSIYRRTGGLRASEAILAAERELAASGKGCGPDGLLTYVWDRKVASANPGYCFKQAGYHVAGGRVCCRHMRPRSADGRKTLLHKPFSQAGGIPCPACYDGAAFASTGLVLCGICRVCDGTKLRRRHPTEAGEPRINQTKGDRI